MTEVSRLSWGCGSDPESGWINSDRNDHPGVDLVCDIRNGLPLESDSMDYVFSMHALQEIPYESVVPVLGELRRVLRPGGCLRLCLPDLDKGIAAYRRGDRDYFLVPDDEAASLGGKLVLHMLWYGHSRLLFTADFAEELLLKAGFSRVDHCEYKRTASPYPEIVELDNRELESMFIEAVK